MSEEERVAINALLVETDLLRLAILDLYRHVHGDGAKERLAAVLDNATITTGDPEFVAKTQALQREIRRILDEVDI